MGFGWMKFGVILILKRWGGGYFAVFLKQVKAPKNIFFR